MNHILNKPFIIFWAIIPIIISIGITNSNETIDINIHDTYFIIDYKNLGYLIGLLFGAIGLGYWIMFKLNRKLSKWLILTIGGLLIMLICSIFFEQTNVSSDNLIFDSLGTLNLILSILILIIVSGQIFYPINIIIGLVKGNKTSR